MEQDVKTGASPKPRTPGIPKCQHCETDPLPLVPAFLAIGGWQVVVFHCNNCGATHGTQIIGSSQPPQEPGLIVKP